MQLRHLLVTLCAVVVALTSVVSGDTARTGGQIARTARRLARQQRQRRFDDPTRLRNVTRRRQQTTLDVAPSTTNETLAQAEKDTADEGTTSDGSGMTTPRPTINIDRWRAKERDKYLRLFYIQSEIIYRLGLKRMPNASSSGYSKEEIVRFEQIFNKSALANSQRTDIVPTDYYAKQFQALTPSCSLPRNTDDVWKSSEAYRLYFAVEPSDGVIKKETNSHFHLSVQLPCSLSRRNLLAADTAGQPAPSTTTTEAISIKRVGTRRRISRRRQNRRAARQSVRRRPLAAVDTNNSRREEGSGRAGRYREESLDEEQAYFNVSVYQYIRPVKNRRRLTDMKRNMVPLSLLHNNNNGDSMSLDMNYTDPSLEILSYEIPKERDSREKRATSKGWFRSSPTCVKETFYDWIVQPEGFEMAVCSGTCPGRDKVGPNHIRQKEKVMYEEKCGPSRLQPFSILHYDDSGNLTVSVLDNFIIADCGCRP
ncbi:hypothetical protein NP493_2308g00016 [Ridgeia piscesae]|uniref:TGF-beta family profile domain-containing protein n=1 Tax=Ridgeia piscesae TaxID=27915 RepID=A0AAD9JJ55_RIDPI|nr:hypothetical protein NP493_2308g00016 [Ridgeia piscesae]